MAPGVADAAASIQDQKPHAAFGKVVTDSQAGLASANHHHVEVLVRGSALISQLPMGLPPLGLPGDVGRSYAAWSSPKFEKCPRHPAITVTYISTVSNGVGDSRTPLPWPRGLRLVIGRLPSSR